MANHSATHYAEAMLSLENARLRLEIETTTLRLIDRQRGCAWECREASADVRSGNDHLQVTRTLHGATLQYHWSLADDHATCTLSVTGTPSRVPLVGRFHPIGGSADAVIPQYQGALLRGRGSDWASEAVRGGHTNLSLGMLALTASTGSLLLIPDDLVGWIARFGDSVSGPWVTFDATSLETVGWREKTLRIYPCSPGVTSVAHNYRRLVQSRGQWRSWADKIADKPSLNRLFGSLIAFIGYVHDPAADYVGGIRKLRQMGFESVMAYPVRFAHYTGLTMADGRPPIALSDTQLAEMRQAGALIAPWAWTYEGLDDGSAEMRRIFRHHASGPAKGWAMDGQQWYHVCPPYQASHIRSRLAADMNAMDWLHFDVNATHPATACWNSVHDAHLGRALSPEDTIAETRRLLGPETVGDRIVSSEGFNDAFTSVYDIGSTKMVPLAGEDPAAVPIPLTMLVYHDCCIHDWWELHSYNANPCWSLDQQHHTGISQLGRAGAGEPHLKAAIDALNGLPPNVFPFGMQYGWVDRPGGKTYPFRMSLDDAAVQEALRCALPVTQLHRRIGKLAMTDFSFLQGNLLLQQTTFADGTRVTANLSPSPAEVPGFGVLPAHAWREDRV